MPTSCSWRSGASSRIARSSVVHAREKGIKAGLIRPITLWPFPKDAIEATMGTAKAYLSVEMNMGQMVDDVRLVVNGRTPVEFYGRTGGVIPTPAEVLAKIEEMNAELSAKGRGVSHGKRDRKIIYQRPHALLPVNTNYCPGCPHGIVVRTVAEVLDELGIEGKTVGVAPVRCAPSWPMTSSAAT